MTLTLKAKIPSRTHKGSGWVSKLHVIVVLSTSLSSVSLQKLQHVVSKSGCHHSGDKRVWGPLEAYLRAWIISPLPHSLGSLWPGGPSREGKSSCAHRGSGHEMHITALCAHTLLGSAGVTWKNMSCRYFNKHLAFSGIFEAMFSFYLRRRYFLSPLDRKHKLVFVDVNFPRKLI